LSLPVAAEVWRVIVEADAVEAVLASPVKPVPPEMTSMTSTEPGMAACCTDHCADPSLDAIVI
jgi:hypothetical protein